MHRRRFCIKNLTGYTKIPNSTDCFRKSVLRMSAAPTNDQASFIREVLKDHHIWELKSEEQAMQDQTGDSYYSLVVNLQFKPQMSIQATNRGILKG